MTHRLIAALCAMAALLVAPASVAADDTTDQIIQTHILPGFATLARSSADLHRATDCTQVGQAPLRAAYHTAFDDWVRVSHLRFGPSEADDRAFALAFWPDSRGKTPKALRRLIAEGDQVIGTDAGMRSVSVAARGFYALELLLFDPEFQPLGSDSYGCDLIRALTADIMALSAGIYEDWHDRYAAQMRAPGPDSPYRTGQEARNELFKALSTGLQFTSESRLGRPLGSFDRPRPARAEARRAGRSARHVALSLESLRALAGLLARGMAQDDSGIAARLDRRFEIALDRLAQLEDPVFAGVATPQGRIRVEALQQSVENIRTTLNQELGPALGMITGFNALDGD